MGRRRLDRDVDDDVPSSQLNRDTQRVFHSINGECSELAKPLRFGETHSRPENAFDWHPSCPDRSGSCFLIHRVDVRHLLLERLNINERHDDYCAGDFGWITFCPRAAVAPSDGHSIARPCLKSRKSVRVAPKARNMIARGKRRAERGASPLDPRVNDLEALKERNNIAMIFRTFSALFNCFPVTRGDALRACPWLSYFRALGAAPTGFRLLGQSRIAIFTGCHNYQEKRQYKSSRLEFAYRSRFVIERAHKNRAIVCRPNWLRGSVGLYRMTARHQHVMD